MKAEELATQLRIGNLLYYKGTTHIAKVELIHNKHFDCRDEYGGFTPDGDYEPIHLSEEMLLNCGFEKDETYVSEEHPWADCVKNDVVISLPYFEFNFESSEVEIKHLHQLQNLYYALTGEELEVSL